MKPLIGITPSPRSDERFGESFSMANTYVSAVEAAGGIPVVLPPHRGGVAELAETLDGVLFSGGGDIRPSRYGDATTHPTTYGISDLRDEFELALLDAALARDLPVLCICRGIQILNVGFGGTLYQDVADQFPGAIAHRPEGEGGARHEPLHTVAAEPGSLVADVYGAETVAANSFHHQTLKEIGAGLEVIGRSADGSIEAVVAPDRRFVLGVQWHPEMMFAVHDEHLRPFARLVEEAVAHRAAKALGAALGD
ncbi:MAG TPA: gamma-glutamyl-gamma-aminobutyrate hydrolase family protein [Thermomicrobiales bacterium]|nr:gamma-glutamyl-gamma-aminobutyrate hydrolase family protein [Thermomicrobiales bacterium]